MQRPSNALPARLPQFSLGGSGGAATIPAVRRGPAPAAPRGAAASKVPLSRTGKAGGSGPASRAGSMNLEQLEAAQQEADALREQARQGWGDAGRACLLVCCTVRPGQQRVAAQE